MQTFWSQGWTATSVRDVVEATGLNTRTMYGLFENKGGLFRAVLQRYCETVFFPPLRALRRGYGVEALETYFREVVEYECNGCLLVNTLSENEAVDPAAREIAERALQRARRVFREKLVEDERFTGDPSATADYLVLLIEGISVSVKHRRGAATRRRMLEVALSPLRH